MASLARTGNTIKYLGAFLRMGILKKFRLTYMSNLSPPPSSQASPPLLSPVAGANEMLPYGVPFDSLSFLYLTPPQFFWFQKHLRGEAFFDPPDFLIWRVGRSVGCPVPPWFLFAYYSKTTRYITLVTFGPLRRRFKTSCVKKWKKNQFLNFSKNFEQNGYIFQKK